MNEAHSKPLSLTHHVKNASGQVVKKMTLAGSLDVQMNLIEHIKSNLPDGHTLELASTVGRDTFSRK